MGEHRRHPPPPVFHWLSETYTRNEAVNCEPYMEDRWGRNISHLSIGRKLEWQGSGARRLRERACRTRHQATTPPTPLTIACWTQVTSTRLEPLAVASIRAPSVIRRSYSRAARRIASMAMHRKKTPTTEPANWPMVRTCHDLDRKHASIVVQFHSMETGKVGQ